MAKKTQQKKNPSIVQEKNKGGQPTKYNEEKLRVIEAMCKLGATDEQICAAIDISPTTITNWKNKIEGLKEKIHNWKDVADEKVERSLFERATGYSCKETKLFCHEGMIVAEDIIKHFPPDPTAMIFWLKNRKPKEWRDKQELSVEDMTDKELISDVLNLVETIKRK